MVSINKIQNYLKDPKEIGQDGMADLRQAVELYPYSGSLVVLYLNALRSHNSLEYKDELSRLSIRINDKYCIFSDKKNTHTSDKIDKEVTDRLNDKEKILHPDENAQETEENQIKSTDQEIQDINTKNEELEETNHTEKDKNDSSGPSDFDVEWNEIEENESIEYNTEENQTQSVAEEPIIFDFDTNDNEVSNEEKIDETEEIAVNDQELEKSITSSAIGSSYFQFNKENSDSTKEKQDKLKDNESPIVVESELKIIENESIETISSKEINEFSTLSFSNWLVQGGYNDSDQNKEKTILQISRKKSKFYSPSENAKKSIDESDIPISEALAKIYEHQGKILKAEEIYQKLCLLNPEKKAYFANLLKKLKHNK